MIFISIQLFDLIPPPPPPNGPNSEIVKITKLQVPGFPYAIISKPLKLIYLKILMCNSKITIVVSKQALIFRVQLFLIQKVTVQKKTTTYQEFM